MRSAGKRQALLAWATACARGPFAPDAAGIRDASAAAAASVQAVTNSSDSAAANGPPVHHRTRIPSMHATTELVEAMQPAVPPSTPLYDLPAWLASNYPRYDTRPKSPFYDWVSWASQHLEPGMASMLLQLDTHMQHPARRAAILRRAQFELARLWDWQHRRLAQGLPAEPSPQEVAAGAAQVVGGLHAHMQALLHTAQDLDGLASAVLVSAQDRESWQQLVAESKAAVHRADAVAARARACLHAPDRNGTALLQAVHEAIRDVQRKHRKVVAMSEQVQRLLRSSGAHATTSSSDSSSSSSSASEGDATEADEGAHSSSSAGKQSAVSPEVQEQVHELEVKLRQAMLSTQAAGAALASLVKQRLGARVLRLAPDSSDHMTDAPDSSDSGHGTAARAPLDNSGTRPSTAAPAPASQEGAAERAGHPRGLLAFMRSKEKELQRELTPEQEQRLASLGLTAEQRAFVRLLHRRSGSMGGATGSVEELVAELQAATVGLRRRIRATNPGARFDRAAELLQSEYLRRKANLAADAAGAKTAVEETRGGRKSPSALDSPGGSMRLDSRLVAALTQGGGAASTTPATWASSPLFNATTKREGAVQAKDTATGRRVKAPAVRPTRWELDDMLLELGAPAPYARDAVHRMPYTWDARVRPPTHVLDLVTDYMQVKYQDVLCRRDAATRVSSLLATVPATTGGTATGGWRGALSPQEVSDLNRRATAAFDAGRVEDYAHLMAQLAQDGWLKADELREHVAAVHRKAAEVAAASTVTPGVAAVPAGDALTPAHRAALLAQLTGAAPGTAPAGDAVTTAARLEWGKAASTGLAALGSTWQGGLKAAVQQQVVKLREQGVVLSGADEAQLLSGVATGQPASWAHANAQWQAFLTAVGALPTAPSLADVVHADAGLRAARAAVQAGSPGAQGQLESAQTTADHINRQLDDLHASWLAKQGTPATHPVPAGPRADANPGATAAGFNAHLDVKDSAKLLSSFTATPRVVDVLRAHWDHVRRTFLPDASPALTWRPDTSPWEQLWGLLRALHSRFAASGVPPSALPPAAAGAATPAPAPLTQVAQAGDDGAAGRALTSRANSAQGAVAGAEQGSPVVTDHEWTEYQHTLDRQLLGSPSADSPAASDDVHSAPPYPGARPILRFTQSVVLGPASSLSSAQDLAGRLKAARWQQPYAAVRARLPKPPVMLPDHPDAPRVELRVQVNELAQEVGLSSDAVQHLLRVAGPERYESTTGDLVIEGGLYPNREENRRWCLERLHLLLQEAHGYQSRRHTGEDGPPPFLLTRPGVSHLLHDQP